MAAVEINPIHFGVTTNAVIEQTTRPPFQTGLLMMQKPVDATAHMLNLGHLTTGTPLFSDHDRDGYPDRIHLSVGIAPNMNSGPVWAGLINLAARLNMESCGPGIAPPVPCMEAENGMLWVNRPAGNMPWAACLEKNRQDGWQLSGRSPLAMKQMLDALATGAISTDPTRAVRFVLTKDEAGWGRVSDQNGTDEWFRMPVLCRDTPPASPQIAAISDLTDFDITSENVFKHYPVQGTGFGSKKGIVRAVDGIDLDTLKGDRLKAFRRQAQIIYQDPYSALNPRQRVGDIIAEPLAIHSKGTKSEQADRVKWLMEVVGLRPGQARRYPHEFSGGLPPHFTRLIPTAVP
jgi:hypothetical protein